MAHGNEAGSRGDRGKAAARRAIVEARSRDLRQNLLYREGTLHFRVVVDLGADEEGESGETGEAETIALLAMHQ